MHTVLLLLTACGTSAEQAVRRQEEAARLSAALQDRHYRMTVTQAHPLRGGSVSVSRDFSLEVRGDTLVSYLPFFGRAYRSTGLGVAEKGLNFTELIRSYEAAPMRSGAVRIRMRVRNEEDSYVYTLDVFPNGQVTIAVRPTQRDPIAFDADMESPF